MIYGEHTTKFQSFLTSMRRERRRCTASSVTHVELDVASVRAQFGAKPAVLQGYLCEDNLPAGMNVVKCVSAQAAWYFGHFVQLPPLKLAPRTRRSFAWRLGHRR